ncbi:MAG TPA: hypothetical protein DEO31_03900 [Streptococcus sp.]|nr:hypothetical protein [Streptococcus sp.]
MKRLLKQLLNIFLKLIGILTTIAIAISLTMLVIKAFVFYSTALGNNWLEDSYFNIIKKYNLFHFVKSFIVVFISFEMILALVSSLYFIIASSIRRSAEKFTKLFAATYTILAFTVSLAMTLTEKVFTLATAIVSLFALIYPIFLKYFYVPKRERKGQSQTGND